ncbi:hypothetical protein GQ457_12G019060 [Hibiscus cannabinus]
MTINVGQHHQPPELVEHVDLIDKHEENISRVAGNIGGDRQQIYSSDHVDFSDTSGDQEIIKCGHCSQCVRQSQIVHEDLVQRVGKKMMVV